jgi:hypothetical protein
VASHTISGQAWADGTTVGVYPAVAVPAGSDVPSGQPVTTSVVAGGSVMFSGLSEKVRYYAYASGVGRAFLIPATSKEGDRARIEMLEAESVVNVPTSTVTRDASGVVTAATGPEGVYSGFVRDSAGRIASFTLNGVAYTVLRDPVTDLVSGVS